jgi:hypothetical protein
VRLLHLRLAQYDGLIATAKDKLPELEAAVPPLQEVADKANAELREAQGRLAMAMAMADIRTWQYDRGQTNLRLQDTVAAASRNAVRSA